MPRDGPDASSAAYAAAVYFTKDKKASLVFAKSRIASIKAKGRLNDNDYELAIDGLIRQAQSEEITEEEIIKWNLYYEEGEI
ncbi:Uncharacterized protein BM_BM17142 [Brugia malayi]|uniref:Uncharacterized protein n=1 Tax=Brugia malayi TaxID=6279 RepID=A0A4E9G3I7_BRUMA|nr:Uncharacterized protein BM_BM17142 [Brugia malayi]VIP00123.1 Uncharacterized protein BM_BM17142 [Brugia malayi]